MEVRTKSAGQTQKVAQNLAKNLKGGEAIAIFGNLGAGKTVFVQGLAKGLGIKRRIISPTFIFIRSYPFTLDHQKLTFHHLDLYRGQDEKDFKALGLDEFFTQDSVVVLEWPEKIKNILPKKRIDVFIEVVNKITRKISIKKRQ